jgi:hypothetical protein
MLAGETEVMKITSKILPIQESKIPKCEEKK